MEVGGLEDRFDDGGDGDANDASNEIELEAVVADLQRHQLQQQHAY